MLDLLSAMVTFTVSSRKASSSGDGKKSEATRSFPKGSSVYLIFLLIDFLTSPPITGANDPNDAAAVRKSDGHNSITDFPKAVIPLLRLSFIVGVEVIENSQLRKIRLIFRPRAGCLILINSFHQMFVLTIHIPLSELYEKHVEYAPEYFLLFRWGSEYWSDPDYKQNKVL